MCVPNIVNAVDLTNGWKLQCEQGIREWAPLSGQGTVQFNDYRVFRTDVAEFQLLNTTLMFFFYDKVTDDHYYHWFDCSTGIGQSFRTRDRQPVQLNARIAFMTLGGHVEVADKVINASIVKL